MLYCNGGNLWISWRQGGKRNGIFEHAGADHPIALRLDACDYMEGGSTIEDGVQACVAFEQVGVNLRTISGGFCSYMRPGVTEPGYFSDATEALKKQVSVPVILTGGIVDAEAAERLLQEGKAGFIGVGRAILKKVLIYTLMHGEYVQHISEILRKKFPEGLALQGCGSFVREKQ